jgi:hypothetical protein
LILVVRNRCYVSAEYPQGRNSAALMEQSCWHPPDPAFPHASARIFVVGDCCCRYMRWGLEARASFTWRARSPNDSASASATGPSVRRAVPGMAAGRPCRADRPPARQASLSIAKFIQHARLAGYERMVARGALGLPFNAVYGRRLRSRRSPNAKRSLATLETPARARARLLLDPERLGNRWLAVQSDVQLIGADRPPVRLADVELSGRRTRCADRRCVFLDRDGLSVLCVGPLGRQGGRTRSGRSDRRVDRVALREGVGCRRDLLVLGICQFPGLQLCCSCWLALGAESSIVAVRDAGVRHTPNGALARLRQQRERGRSRGEASYPVLPIESLAFLATSLVASKADPAAATTQSLAVKSRLRFDDCWLAMLR